MFENLFNLFRRTRHIKALDLCYENIPEVRVSLNTFESISKGGIVYETPQDLTYFNSDGAIRYVKKGVNPPIIQTSKLEIHPDHVSARITVDKKTLFAIALREHAIVVETPSEYIIPLGISFVAPKGKS